MLVIAYEPMSCELIVYLKANLLCVCEWNNQYNLTIILKADLQKLTHITFTSSDFDTDAVLFTQLC